jgi:hypothetical protein
MRTNMLIRQEGLKALRNSLGLIDAEKFLVLVHQEPFDYTEWQKTLWHGQTVDELFEAAKKYAEIVQD